MPHVDCVLRRDRTARSRASGACHRILSLLPPRADRQETGTSRGVCPYPENLGRAGKKSVYAVSSLDKFWGKSCVLRSVGGIRQVNRFPGWRRTGNRGRYRTAQKETPHPGGPPGEALSGPVRAGQRVPTGVIYPRQVRFSIQYRFIFEIFSKMCMNPRGFPYPISL